MVLYERQAESLPRSQYLGARRRSEGDANISESFFPSIESLKQLLVVVAAVVLDEGMEDAACRSLAAVKATTG